MSNCAACRECKAQEDLCKSCDDKAELLQTNAIDSNINVFAFAFVITFCGIVTMLDLFLLKFLIFWHRFRGLFAPRINAWVEDGIFQLQRRAYEAYGQGTWEHPDKEVPITTDDADLARFNLKSNPTCKCTHSSPTGGNALSAITTAASEPDGSERTRTVDSAPHSRRNISRF
jgi:hypothetical protein